MGQIKKRLIVIAFGLTLSNACLSQQQDWKTEHHETMVVPPYATDITFRERGYQDELTYTVEESYPASKFVHDLCEQLRLKGWESSEGWPPSGKSVCEKPEWTKVPAPSSVKYRLDLPFHKSDDDHPNGEATGYDLEYRTEGNEHHARTLRVDTWAIHSEVAPPQMIPSAKPSPRILSDRVYRIGFFFLYLLALIVIVWLLTLGKVRSAVFYSGPGAWLTWINLGLFAPVVLSFLSIGGILVAALGPAINDNPAEGAAAIAVLVIWLILWLFSITGYVAGPVVVLLVAKILFANTLPRNVKIGHALLGLLSLSFFGACILGYSGPLIRW